MAQSIHLKNLLWSLFLIFFMVTLPASGQTGNEDIKPHPIPRMDFWAAPASSFSRSNPEFKFYYHYLADQNKKRVIGLPTKEQLKLFHGNIVLHIDGDRAPGDRGLAGVFRYLNDIQLSGGESADITINLKTMFKYNEHRNWNDLRIMPYMVQVNRERDPYGFHGKVIVSDPYISNRKQNRHSEQTPRLDTWVFVTPDNKFDRDHPVVTVQYHYVAEQDPLTIRLPGSKQIDQFKKLNLYADGQKLNRKEQQKTSERVTYKRKETLRPGDRVSLSVDLSKLFKIPAEWKKLLIETVGKGVPEGAEEIPRGFKGSYIILDTTREQVFRGW